MDKYFMVDLAIKHSYKPCIGEPCDLESPCKRHARTLALVIRLKRRLANAKG